LGLTDITVLSIREAYINHPAKCRHCGKIINTREKCIIVTLPDEPVSGDILVLLVLSVYHQSCYNLFVEPVIDGVV